MKIIFIGSAYPVDREAEIRDNSKSGIDNAANNLQWALFSGLDYYFPRIEIITQPAIGTYPLNYKKVYFKESYFSHKAGTKDYTTGFINLPIIKHFSKYWSLQKVLRNLACIDEEIVIIVYALHSPFLKACVNIKNNNPKVKILQVVPDLPRFMSGSKNPAYRFLKLIDSIIIKYCIKKVDGFVFLSEGMTKELKVGTRPWTIMEGIYRSEIAIDPTAKEKNKTILYVGNIDERYGIRNLIKAFSLINDNDYRLWIRGNGKLKDYIIKATKSDSRIVYLEEMPRQDLLKYEKRATILINPVPSTEKFTKYFFPSKTLEYLASGTPCIMHRLSGIPSDYFNYVFVAESEDPVGLKEKIMEVCSKEQSVLDDFGARAARFINEAKTPIVQAKKIADLIEKL